MSSTVTLRQRSGYSFDNAFGEAMAVLVTDLPAPTGRGEGPSPEHLLAAAVANCLSSSLVFALSRYQEDPAPLTTTASAIEGRNERNRMRVQRIDVKITLGRAAADLPHVERAIASFEEFCTVTASVRQAIPVEVEIYDARQ